MSRYSKHIILSEIGQKGQDKLNNAKVLVIGAGGLGCPILQYLTAAGIGTLGIIDFDVVEISNLQRQVLFGESSLGKNKAISAKERLTDLNNTITINAYAEKLTHKNVIDLFKQYDVIVDGSDNFETRYLVNDACIITNKPLVFGAIYKFEGQVSVFNYNNGPSYRCLFPNMPKQGSVPNCSDIGVLGVLPGIIGNFQANEVLKTLLGIGNVLSGEILFYNALTNNTSTLKINKSEEEINKVLAEADNFQNKTTDSICEIEITEKSIETVWNKSNIQFIDVRELQELPKVKELEVTEIPLSELVEHINHIHPEKEKAIFCQSGIRSKQAVSILKEHHITNCFGIIEGASEINNFIEQQKAVSNGR